jgi:hypothetical protein
MLAQHNNNLILGKSASPHRSSPSDELTYQWHISWEQVTLTNAVAGTTPTSGININSWHARLRRASASSLRPRSAARRRTVVRGFKQRTDNLAEVYIVGEHRMNMMLKFAVGLVRGQV